MAEDKAFQLVAGHLALDFVNTLDHPKAGESAEESLRTYADLLRFAELTGVCTPARRRVIQKGIPEAQHLKALQVALTLRANLRELFTAAAQERATSEAALEEFNRFLEQALARRKLHRTDKQLTWTWQEQPDDAVAPLWPIVFAAAGLLTSPQGKLVRQCANGNCGWLFLDTSKNHSRRWCEMKTCGNRVKARNHYQRVRLAMEEQS